MNSLSPDQLVEQIHDSPTRIVLAVTGGGSRAIADLLEVPGASRTLLEAVVPYAPFAMTAWLGTLSDSLCSAATARAMAMAAFHRAREFEAQEGSGAGVQGSRPECPATSVFQFPNLQINQSPNSAIAGIACTASLASDRPKRGPHRLHIALQTASLTAAWHLRLLKDRRSRAEEERLAGRLLLNIVAEACQVAERLSLDLLEGEQIEASRVEAPPAWQELLLGRSETVRIGPGDESPKAVLPGAFNPLHDGHRRMMQVAQQTLEQSAAAEVSILNVDKPPLDFLEIERRLRQFPTDQTVFLTRAATFDDKSRLFAGATFIVGVDTLRRIADPRYHGNDPAECRRAIERIAAQGCRFLVFGRDLGAGFVRLADLDVPDSLRAISREVPPEIFREDASSSALRKLQES